MEQIPMSDPNRIILASVGTDGTDGPTDAAGAVVDATTVRHDVEAAREALVTTPTHFWNDLANFKMIPAVGRRHS